VKIVSLVPSATEIVFALGAGDELIGVTFECDHPPEARAIRVVSEAVVGGGGEQLDAGAIDAAVRDRLAAGEPLYRLDHEYLAAERPDVVLTQDLCRVCAVPTPQVDRALALVGSPARVVSVDPHSLDDVIDSVVVIGDAIDRSAAAESVTSSLRERLAAVARAVAGRARPRVLVLEWVDPPFLAGHWLPDVVRAAGAIPVGATPVGVGTEGWSCESSWPELRELAADVVIVAPCGFALDRSRAEATRAGAELDAPAVYAGDANGHFTRPGPRLVDTVEAIAAALHPDAGLPERSDVLARL
jgi:iron complex transport system substrate-binding protein